MINEAARPTTVSGDWILRDLRRLLLGATQRDHNVLTDCVYLICLMLETVIFLSGKDPTPHTNSLQAVGVEGDLQFTFAGSATLSCFKQVWRIEVRLRYLWQHPTNTPDS
jgi:hypothetical protein